MDDLIFEYKELSTRHIRNNYFKFSGNFLNVSNTGYKHIHTHNNPIFYPTDALNENIISFFIEGVEFSDYNRMVKIEPIFTYGRVNPIYTSDISKPVFLENIERAKSYTVSSLDWKIDLSKNQRMIRGFIEGGFTISGCDGEISESQFTIRCYRQYDHHFIGEYPLVGFRYHIPNLNFEFEYDLILIDNTKNLEQKILSHRKPTPYPDEFVDPTDFTIKYVDGKVYVTWFSKRSDVDVYICRSKEYDTPFDKINAIDVVKGKNIFIDDSVEYGQTYYYKFGYMKNDLDIVSDVFIIQIKDDLVIEHIESNIETSVFSVETSSEKPEDFTYRLYMMSEVDLDNLPNHYIDVDVVDGIITLEKLYGDGYVFVEAQLNGGKIYSNVLSINNGIGLVMSDDTQLKQLPLELKIGG